MFLGECVDNTVLGHIFIEDDLAGNTWAVVDKGVEDRLGGESSLVRE